MTSKSTRTFIDSSVLIAAWRGNLNLRIKALTVLSDAQREFISSPFVRLEVRPKAIFHKNQTTHITVQSGARNKHCLNRVSARLV